MDPTTHQHEPGTGGPLAHIPLFAGMHAGEQDALMQLMQRQRVEANQTVVWMGDRGDSLYLVERGSVGVLVVSQDGEQVPVSVLRPGEIFGEISLLDGGPRTATVRTLEPTDLLVLDREAFRAFLLRRPEAALDILEVMGQRHRASTEALRGLKNPNELFEARLNLWQRTSDVIAATAASPGFMLAHVTWFGLWIGLNIAGSFFDSPPRLLSFDPFPFGLLTMVVSLEAIFLAIFVMVSQNRQAEKDRLRTDLDYQVNVKAETEVLAIARRLERIEELLTKQREP